ncbi:nuclear pore complex protein Nup98-Nup96 isoform X1 [Parasteatoda tepidariorum]|uniref:nuclear pore complex protein Nup98-Nup96 isoform X1 n=1 Tax=Parasteatoda tepidariorum TaxID=114398 RepID=UPI000A2BFD7A|nr:nuclear pore complex protein Nup98-Nup96 isoform X2 [Parasteatoda tepidariorum]
MFGNSKPFGTASAFGASTFGNTSTPFGQSTTAFGAKPAANNVFGSTGFGVQTPAAPMSGSLFGGSTPASGTGLFGQPTTGFGAPASTSSGGFGGFGAASNSGGLFGGATPSTQTAGGLFGATNTSAFGTPRPAFGGFGTTNTATGLFGQNTSTGTSLFGSTGVAGGFNAATQSGTTIKFNAPTGTDTMMKAGVSTSIGTRHQCITCMKEYENKSLEELRMEDYAANRKGGGATPALGFGNTTQTTGGLFGAPAAASTSAFSFGNTTQSKPLFGSTGGMTNNTFGTTGGGLFGGGTQQTQNTGLFGKSVGFGAPSTSTAPAFSFGGTNNTSLFGQNNQQKPLFGQTTGTTGLFGNTATTQATGFGGTSTGFGAFGANTQQTGGLFGAKPTGFGTTNTTTTNTFSFGTPNNMTGGGLFGQKSTAPAFGSTGFGGNQTSSFGSFGATQATGTNLFGQNKPAATPFTGNLFGAGLGTGAFGSTPSNFSMGALGTNTGTSLFGGTTANKAPGSFGFGNTNPSTFSFGGNNANASSFNFGGASSQLPSTDPNNSMALQQIQQQILAMASNPFGDNPLFRIPIKDSSREIEVLKPTNPSAQKALLNDSHYKVDLLPTAKIKPKPWAPVPSGKVFLFDGLEDEEPSLGSVAFVPKRSIKKLVLKNIGNSDSSLTLTSDVSTSQPTRIDVSISLKSPQNITDKSHGDQNAPLTTNVSDRENNTAERRLLSGGESPSLEITREILSSKPDLVPNLGSSFNDSIAALHTNKQRFTGQTINVWNDSADDSRNYSLDESLNTTSNVDEESNVNSAGIKLTKSGYYTLPSMEEISSLFDENKRCFVNNFTVGRKGYGKVMFPGVTNVADLNLDEIVCFQKKEITVYPDDDKKPPVGEELNKRAEVTLDGVWPIDKTTHTLIKDSDRLEKMGYKEKIRNSTTKLGAKFIDYIPDTGSWIFEVEHFSKYGLEDSDEEEMDVVKPVEKNAGTENKQVNGFQIPGFVKQTVPKTVGLFSDQDMEITSPKTHSTHLNFINDKNFIQDFTGTVKPILSSMGDAVKIKEMKSSLFEEGLDDSMLDNNFMQDFTSPVKSMLSNVSDAVKIKEMKASLFEEDMDDFSMMGSPLYTGKKDSFFYQKEIPSLVSMQATPSMSYADQHLDVSQREVQKKIRYDQENESPSISSFKKPDIGIQKSLSNLTISSTNPPEWLTKLPIVNSSTQHVPPQPSSKAIACTSNKICLKRFNDSVLFDKQHLIADAGYFMGRTFRNGWDANSVFTCLNSSEEDKTDPLQKLFFKAMKRPSKTSHQKSSFVVSLKKIPMHLLADTNDRAENYLIDVLKLQLKNSASTMDNGAPLFISKPGVELIHELANLFEKQLSVADPFVQETDFIRQCVYVWDLLVSLWGKIRDLRTDENTSNFAIQIARRRALSNWLIKSTECDLKKRISNVSKDGYLKKIFLSLIGRQTKEAIQFAQEHRDFRLSLLLAQSEGTSIVRNLISKQLFNWEESDACKFISEDRILIYTLLSGMLVWENKFCSINCCQDLSWKEALSLELWYHCNPNSSIQEAVNQYDKSFESKYSSPPYPSYVEGIEIESEDQDSITEYDTCYHILKLYCDRSYRFELLLMPETYTTDHLDYRLSWLLHLALTSIGFNIPSDLACTLHSNFASQLESLDMWHWSVFVILHHPDATWRTKTVKDILLRHVTLEQNKLMSVKETFLLESLLIPEQWIYEAKAIRAGNEGNRADEAWYLLKAGCWSKSHKIVLKYLVSNAVINEDFEFLMRYLNELSPPERSCTIQDWNSGGQVYLDYIHMCQVVQEVLSHEASAYDLEKFAPEVVCLCKRLSSIPISSLKDSLSVAEMAKKTATILRSICILQATRNKSSSSSTSLSQSLKHLPMPHDYAVPECRFITHCFADEITSGN